MGILVDMNSVHLALTTVYPSYLLSSRELLWNMLKKEQKVQFSGLLLGENKIMSAKKQLQILSETPTYTQFHQIKVAVHLFRINNFSLVVTTYCSLPYLISHYIDTYFLWLIIVAIPRTLDISGRLQVSFGPLYVSFWMLY